MRSRKQRILNIYQMQLNDISADVLSMKARIECIYRILDRWERKREDKKSEE